MHNLVPHFIHDQYQANNYHGTIEAVTLFIDISGFTAMTQALMKHGKEGAEIMSDIINRIFEPLIHAVYDRGGFIVGFAGDAFSAVFFHAGEDTALSACKVTWDIRQVFIEQGQQKTRLGTFDLVVKQGLSAGMVEWGILGPEGHKAYFFRGPGIDGCAQSEHQAHAGDIILDRALQQLLPAHLIELQRKDEHYAKLVAVSSHVAPDTASTPPSIPLYPSVVEQFYLSFLLNLTQPGEFRDVISVFISFQDIQNRETLDNFVSQIIQVIDRYDGYFNRLDYGDKGGNILVFFGAPVAHENDIERALDSVLALKHELASLPDFQWRAGITYGRGRAGFVGSSLRSEYTVLGSSVNLSARLMMQANWGEALVSDTIAQHPAFKFEHLEDIAYKGFNAPVPTYKLLRKRSAQAKIFKEAMVGRQAELVQLLAAAQPIFNGAFAGAATIYGEPGIGKSRLSFALQETLPDSVAWFIGQTDQILRTPFNPFVYFLRQYFNQVPNAAPEENKAAFKQRFELLTSELTAAQYPPNLKRELHRTQSILGALVGLHWKNSLYETLDAPGRYENSLFAVKTLLQAESYLHPVVFELEDAHGLDKASHELLTTITRQMDGYPLFIIITSRYADDGSRPALTFAPDTPQITIDLNILPPEALHALAQDILGGPIDSTLTEILQEKTQANPFFAQQMLYYFRENKLLEQNAEAAWRVKDTSFELPISINTMLMARIDRLAHEIKDIVKIASVLGRDFEVRLLSKIIQANVFPVVRQAEDEQIWSPLRELHYIFKHALLRDAVYEMQLRARLRELHQLAAEAHIQLYSDLRPYYAELAFHYGQAQNETQERRFARLAGEQASDQYANDEAVRYLSRALALTPETDNTARYELLHLRESVFDHVGDRDAQAKDLETLGALADTLDIPEKRATFALRQANYHLVTSDYPAAIEAAGQAIKFSQQALAPETETKGHIIRGKAAWQQSAYEEAKTHLEHAAALAKQAQNRSDEAESYLNLGAVYWYQGDHTAAQERYQEALTTYQEIGDRQNEAGCLSSMGAIHGELGDYVAAQHYSEQALTICQEIGYRRGETILNANLGVDYYDLGDYATAQAYLNRALKISREAGNRWVEALSLDTLGLVHQGLGVPEAANDFYAGALTIQRNIGDRNSIGYTLTHLGHTLTSLRKFETAAETYAEALALRRELGQENLAIDILAGLAYLAQEQDQGEQAYSRIKEILAWIETNEVGGIEYPVQVYLICYRILRAVSPSTPETDEQAQRVLAAGHTLLQKRAANIKDEALRRKFLENVPYNRELLEIRG